jgi:menaquinone-9 beta-reductase
MARSPHFDVVVVGASIAGCTAATLFGREGLRVALVERHRDPATYKVLCTHYIQASATPTIRRLGIDSQIESSGGLRNAIDAWTRWGWSRPAVSRPEGAEPYGYNVRRSKLDPMLRRFAAETDGVELMLGFAVEDLLASNGAVEGLTVRDASERTLELRAPLVVGADGNHSRVAQLAGVETKTRPNNRFGYFAYYRDLLVATGTRSQMWFAGRDIAYTFPNDDGLTILACMPAKTRLPDFQRDLEGSFAAFFARLPEAPPIEQAERVSKLIGIVDYPLFERQAAPRPGLALVGDAALTSDPLWGVGCGWAFQTAEWLVESTAPALKTRDRKALAAALAGYGRRHRKALKGHQFLIADFARGRDFNPLERLMFSAAARDQRLAQHVEQFGTRSIPVRRFLAPSALARAALVDLRFALGRPRAAPEATPAEHPAR